MAPQATIRIEGVKELFDKLDRIAGTGSKGRRTAKAMMRKAMRAGSAPIRKRAKATTPRDTGNLHASIAVKVKQYPSGVTVGIVGPRAKFTRTRTRKGVKRKEVIDAFYAHMVEGGTKPHQIPKRPTQAKTLSFISGGGTRFRKVVMHPGAKAQPFIQKAADRSEKLAAAAFAKKLGEELRKEAVKRG
jgi:HK97 gp10 family phage protein